MHSILDRVVTTLREEFLAHPVRLTRMLATHKGLDACIPEPSQCADASTIVRWDQWRPLNPSTYFWREIGGKFVATRLDHSKVDELGIHTTIENWGCDITDVMGLSSSKADLRRFATLDELVEADSPEMITSISRDNLRENLAHREIRILLPNSSDYFARYAWDGRIFLINSGGSHHFSAARYIAFRLGERVPLKGKLVTCAISRTAVSGLRRDFTIFAVHRDVLPQITSALHRLRAAHCTVPMPAPYHYAEALLLPRDDRRASRVAGALETAGVFDLGTHLRNLASRQQE